MFHLLPQHVKSFIILIIFEITFKQIYQDSYRFIPVFCKYLHFFKPTYDLLPIQVHILLLDFHEQQTK